MVLNFLTYLLRIKVERKQGTCQPRLQGPAISMIFGQGSRDEVWGIYIFLCKLASRTKQAQTSFGLIDCFLWRYVRKHATKKQKNEDFLFVVYSCFDKNTKNKQLNAWYKKNKIREEISHHTTSLIDTYLWIIIVLWFDYLFNWSSSIASWRMIQQILYPYLAFTIMRLVQKSCNGAIHVSLENCHRVF